MGSSGQYYHQSTLLVIDDDPAILEALDLHWKHKEIPFKIIFCETVEDALRILATEPVDVVLTDQQLPDATGLFLITEINRRHPLIKVILMTARPSEETRLKALALGAVEFLSKPFELETLDRLLIDIKSIKHTGFSGIINQLSLADLVQLKCSTLARVKIVVKSGKLEGILYFEKGSLLHALMGEFEGDEAFYKIFSWRRGLFEEHPYVDHPQKNISRGWEGLLLEAAQKKDEVTVESDQDFDSLEDAPVELPEVTNDPKSLDETKMPPDPNAVVNLGRFNELKGALICSRSGSLLSSNLDEHPNQAAALASFLMQQGQCLARILSQETVREVFVETDTEKRLIFLRGHNLVAVHAPSQNALFPGINEFKKAICPEGS